VNLAELDQSAADGILEDQEDEEHAPEAPKDDRSVADILVDIAEAKYDFGTTEDGEVFGVPRSGPRIVRLLRGGKSSLRAQLAQEYRRQRRKVAGQQALASAMLCLEGAAQEAEPVTLWQRVARHGDVLWLDLGDQTGRAVKITPAGWSVEDQAPVLFKRTALTSALPEPEAGGTLDELWPWLNVTEADRPLIAAALVSMLHPTIPHPMLAITGEQGTGKTTATKVLVSILDPSPVPCRKAPKDAESWVTAASGSWVVALENLSSIPEWLSDSLCRAVTGDGDVRRRLYTDGDLAVFAFRRCLVANGIDFGALKGDLADRVLPVELGVISEAKRLPEDGFWPGWGKAHPRILAAVLDLTAAGLAALPSVHLRGSPRMADFARIQASVDTVLGTKGLARYLDKQTRAAADALTGDPFITELAARLTEPFTGTAGELLDWLTPEDPKWRAPKTWPDTARKVTTRLRRQAPVMRKAGWQVTDDEGRNHAKVTNWTILPSPKDPQSGGGGKRDPRDPQDPQTASDQGEQVRVSCGSESPAAGYPQVTRAPAGQRTARDPHPGNAPTSENTTLAGHAGLAGQKSAPLHSDPPCRCGRTAEQHRPGDWGPCVTCGTRIPHRYGPGSRTRCQTCMEGATP
jgi:hypothetical protein